MKKMLCFLFTFFMFAGCGSANLPAEIKTKKVEVFNDTLTIPETGDVSYPDNEQAERVAYVLFDDIDDKDAKWNNYVLVDITKGVNATDGITYNQAKTVLELHANTFFGFNSQITNVKTEMIDLTQTPAVKATAQKKDGSESYEFYFVMNNWHDVGMFWFFHKKEAKVDYTKTFENMMNSIYIGGLDGANALKDNPNPQNSTGAMTDVDESPWIIVEDKDGKYMTLSSDLVGTMKSDSGETSVLGEVRLYSDGRLIMILKEKDGSTAVNTGNDLTLESRITYQDSIKGIGNVKWPANTEAVLDLDDEVANALIDTCIAHKDDKKYSPGIEIVQRLSSLSFKFFVTMDGFEETYKKLK